MPPKKKSFLPPAVAKPKQPLKPQKAFKPFVIKKKVKTKQRKVMTSNRNRPKKVEPLKSRNKPQTSHGRKNKQKPAVVVGNASP